MKRLSVVMYHYTRDLRNSRYPAIKGMDISLFREQIAFFVRNFNVVTMEDVMDACERNADLPDKALLVTFDDGYIDHYVHAFPVLDEFGIQGSFFIPGKTFSTHCLLDVNKVHYILASGDAAAIAGDLRREMDAHRGKEFDFKSTGELYAEYGVPNRFDNGDTIFVKRMLQTVLPERLRNLLSSKLFAKYVGVSEEQLAHELYLNEDQIRTMRRHGMHIGLHGYDHYWLGNLETGAMRRDIDMALDALEGFLDRSAWAIAYPYGSRNPDVLEYVKSKGAKVGLTTEVRVCDFSADSPLLVPRLDCNDFPPKSENYLKF